MSRDTGQSYSYPTLVEQLRAAEACGDKGRFGEIADTIEKLEAENRSLLSLVQRLLDHGANGRDPWVDAASGALRADARWLQLRQEARTKVAGLGGGEDMAVDHWKNWHDGWLPRKYATREEAEGIARLAGRTDPVVGAFNRFGKLVEDVPLTKREEGS